MKTKQHLMAAAAILIFGMTFEAMAFTASDDDQVKAAAGDVLKMQGMFEGASVQEASDIVVRIIAAAVTGLPEAQQSRAIALIVAQAYVETGDQFAGIMALVIGRVEVARLELAAAAAVYAAGGAGESVGAALQAAVKTTGVRAALVDGVLGDPANVLGVSTSHAIANLLAGQGIGNAGPLGIQPPGLSHIVLPAAVQSAAVQPAAVQSAAVQPAAVQPATVQSAGRSNTVRPADRSRILLRAAAQYRGQQVAP